MPPPLRDPVLRLDTETEVPIRVLRDTVGKTPTPGAVRDPVMQLQPEPVSQPEASDTGDFRSNVERVQARPDYFDDLNRVHAVGTVNEIVETGIDELEARRQAKMAVTPPLFQLMSEIPGAGVVETGAKMMINFMGEGLSSAVALLPSMWADEPGTFAESTISAQGKIAAAHGRFYDYEPLMETTDRNLEALESFFQGTVGEAGNFLGNEVMELTGSPLLAASAKLLPDAVLMALPFLPKGIRSMRNARAASRYEAELRESTRTAVGRKGYLLEVVETADDVPSALMPGEGLPAGSFSLRVTEPSSGAVRAELDAVARGESVQIVNIFVDPGIQGKGIAQAMFTDVVGQAASRGYKSVVSDTFVSEQAAAVIERQGRSTNGRLVKNETAELVTVDESMIAAETVMGSKFEIGNRAWVSGDDQPIYTLVLDEPAATSTLTSTRMKVETLQTLRGEAPPLDPARLTALADDLKSGKTPGDIIVETVEGTPVGILAGGENIAAMEHAATTAGLRIRNLVVKLQERETLAPRDIADLRSQATAGMRDLVENQNKIEASERAQNRTIWQKLRHMFVDTSGNVKAEIIKQFGEGGQIVIRDFSLKAGALPKAHMGFQDFHKSVYARRGAEDLGLDFSRNLKHLERDVSEVDLFNILVQSRRTQAIVKSGGARTHGGRFQLAGAVKPENAAGNIWAIRETLGDARFAQLQSRADTVFDTMHKQLVRLRDNGIITHGQFLRMQNIDYITREFIEAIDPIMLAPQRGGATISVGESGIYHLKGGSARAQNIDVQSLVAEYLARTEGRIFRNNANRTLYQVAKAEPDNSLVKIARENQKIPEGYSELRVMIDGRPQRMFMRDIYAQEWVVNDPGMNVSMANFFRIVNGTFLVKPLATGMNPAFAVVNFPRDIMHLWKATGNQYNAFLPRYIGQIFHDLWEIRSDAWNKTGVYRDFIDEGGGMSFLTHGGFDPLTGFNRAKDLLRTVGVYKGSFGRWWSETKETLSKINEFSELSVRLAIRNRVIKNQQRAGQPIDTKQGTFIARDYLDFSQGGSITKAMESFIPYTNAASQAIRTAYREYGRGGRAASVAALKDAQVIAIKAAQSAWAWSENPEVMSQVDTHTLYTSQVYPTGLSYVDDRGNRRHLTINIAMDTSTLPFTAMFDALIAKQAMLDTGIDPNYIPSDHLLAELVKVIPILGNIQKGTPTLQAAVALASNKNLWTNRDIWTGDPAVQPGARRTDSTEGTPFETLGTAFPETVSPVQAQRAWKTIVPSNFYIDSADWIRQQVNRATDPVAYQQMVDRETSDIVLMLLAEAPGLNRLVHLTHPAAQTTDELRTLASDVATWRELERQAIDNAVERFQTLGDSEALTGLIERVASVRPQDTERVTDLLFTNIAVEAMYENNKYDIGFVGQDWFNTLAGRDPETRAELYYWKTVELSEENARNLDAVIAQIDKVGGRRIRTEDFDNSVKQLIAKFGTRQERSRGVMGGPN